MDDSRARVMVSVHQVRSWLGSAVLLDAAAVGSWAHRPRLWWTNLMSPALLKRAFDGVQRPAHLTVDSILDTGRQSQRVRHDDRLPLAVVNRVGQPRAALPTLLSFPGSHAFRDGGPGLLWDSQLQQLVEPNADERERAMGFITGTTAVPSLSEASRRQVLGQAMDLNCLTWIISLAMAEQRRVRSTLPFMISLPTETVQAASGGEQVRTTRCRPHPWHTWEVLEVQKELTAKAAVMDRVGDFSRIEEVLKDGMMGAG